MTDFNYLDHWPGKWPKRSFTPLTNPKILDRIITHEQSLLLATIERLRQKSPHTPVFDEGGISHFQLAVHYIVTYRVMYLQNQGWPMEHKNKLHAIFAQCAPKIDIIEMSPEPPPP